MAAAISKQNARQHAKRKGYYERQFDRTDINKTIGMVRHVANYADRRIIDKLRQESPYHMTLVRGRLKGMGAGRLLGALDNNRI